METPGSSKLTDEQADFYAGRFGERYAVIAENPLRPSRKMRRAQKFGAGRQRLTGGEVELFNRQQEAARRLEQQRIQPL